MIEQIRACYCKGFGDLQGSYRRGRRDFLRPNGEQFGESGAFTKSCKRKGGGFAGTCTSVNEVVSNRRTITWGPP